MKERTVIIFKLVCFLAVPLLTPFIGLLKPLQESGAWPNGVQWTVTLIVAAVGMFNAGLAFSSGSFAKWRQNQNDAPK